MDIIQYNWQVSNKVARPVNPYIEPIKPVKSSGNTQVDEFNAENYVENLADYKKLFSEFEQFAAANTFATDAPDKVYPGGAFEKGWLKKNTANGDSYFSYDNAGLSGYEYTSFLRLKQQPEFTEEVSGAMLHFSQWKQQPEQVETVDKFADLTDQQIRTEFLLSTGLTPAYLTQLNTTKVYPGYPSALFMIDDAMQKYTAWQSQQQAARIDALEQQNKELKERIKLYHELATVSKIGIKLKELRKSTKHTLRQIEDATGISNAYLSQLENGKVTNPSLNTVNKLLGFLIDGKAVERYELTRDWNMSLPEPPTPNNKQD